jgi:RNA polymerase-binding protein DksA
VSPTRKTSSSRSGSSRKKTSAKKTAKSSRKTTSKGAARKITRAAGAKKKVRKPTAKKTAARKTTARKPATKKTTKKSVSKKTPARSTTARAAASATRSAGTATGDKRAVEAAPVRKVAGRRVKPTFKTPIRKLPVKKSRPARPAKLNAEMLRKIRQQLQGERADLVRQQEELEEDSFEGTQSELTGEVGLDEDFADAGTATFDRERDLSIRNNIRDLIEQIDRAIRRIDENSYGSCERCGKPIDAARLKALPHASLCLDCKRREERVR